jgi:hypothetical protein
VRDSGLMATIFPDPVERKYWSRIWEKLLDQRLPDSWAYRWAFTCMVNGGLSILPNANLVVNIGFGEDAPHTTGAPPIMATNGLATLEAPSLVLRDSEADSYTFNHALGRYRHRFLWGLSRFPKRLVRNMLFCKGSG